MSTTWLLQGIDKDSSLVSVDENEQFISIAKKLNDYDKRVTFITGQGEDVILSTTLNLIGDMHKQKS